MNYQVVYITFQTDEEEDEITYFIANEEVVSETLACVAEFWQHASKVGREVDFTVAGCRTKAFCDKEL